MAPDRTTEAIVLGSHKLGDADRIVTLFTADHGKVPTVVKGVRKAKSRFGGRLEPFTHLEVQLHKGRTLHTLTGADTIKTHSSARDRPASLKAGLSFIDMVGRSAPEHDYRPRTFNLLKRFLAELDRAGRHNPDNLAMLSLGAQLKLLLLAGYLPHLSSCAGCGREAFFSRFSAAVGGSLCPDCKGDSFAVAPETLKTMMSLLENPLAAAPDVKAGTGTPREIWQAVSEVCLYHLGIVLKIKPWLEAEA